MLFKSLLSLASPGGRQARLSVLIFHRVMPEPDPLFPQEMYAARFDALCAWMATWFQVLPLDEAVLRLKGGTLPSRAACITFDDGYADNHDVALPILQRHGLSATFFIATGYLNGGRMWNDSIIEAIRACTAAELDLGALQLGHHALGSIEKQRLAVTALIDQIKYLPAAQRIEVTEAIAARAGVRLPTDLMMRSEQVLALRRQGMQIGAHTVTHPILARLDDAQAEREIVGSRRFLEQLLGERVGLFAYPNGRHGEDYSMATVDLVRRQAFDAAVTTNWGVTQGTDDLMQMRRFTPWDASRIRFGLRMLSNLRMAPRV